MKPTKKSSKISKAARHPARLRRQKNLVLRLVAISGNRAHLQVLSRGKVIGSRKVVGLNEHTLRQVSKALKKAELKKART